MEKKPKNRGFTLIELIISIGVISAVLTGAFTLISMSFSTTTVGKSRVVAIGLVQEGLEIVRNIRDNNWLAGKRDASSWRDGLGEGNYRVQYDKLTLLSPSANTFKIDSNGFYYYDDPGGGGPRANSVSTTFTRNINIQYIGNNQIKLSCRVEWKDRGRTYFVSAGTILYNWLEPQE
jgi:prepilin-type N-terminal cleavage/methylation domain-containing protein